MKEICQKEAVYIIFTHQGFRNSDSPIELYTLERWCKTATEGDRHLFFSDGPVEKCVGAKEVEDVAEEVEEILFFSLGGG